MSFGGGLKSWAKRLKAETYALYLAYKDPRTPWYAKVFAGCVAAYALSPIDLIPDFVPVLGYLDDVVLLPIGIYFAIKIVPADVMEESRKKAAGVVVERGPSARVATVAVIFVWSVAAVVIAWVLFAFILTAK
ncbi:MAG: DUF1232 domain-containing protein [Candidatus Coatesbacteria bacterium]|nr:MAG: DUF1232 domain-containing protein [Candidatus Coatesbacteria bacterium]